MSRTSSRILLVEDEGSLAAPIRRGLTEEGYHVNVVGDAGRAMAELTTGEYDLAIVDWRLPGMDGRTLIERMRERAIGIPVLMLTALQDLDHRVAGLDAGADDYLTKPFAFEELLARLRALLRRARERTGAPARHRVHLHAGPLEMDTARRTTRLAGKTLDLRAKEYHLLELLMRSGGQLVTRTMIAERVWGSAFDVTDNAIDVTVSNLRARLGDGGPTPGGDAAGSTPEGRGGGVFHGGGTMFHGGGVFHGGGAMFHGGGAMFPGGGAMFPGGGAAVGAVTIETVRGLGYRLLVTGSPDGGIVG